MRQVLVLSVIIVLCSPVWPHKRETVSPMPDQFVVGRRTFFDFGPPFDYYDLYVVRPSQAGAEVQRITLTPPGALCRAMPKIEVSSAYLPNPPAALLGSINPCSIPEKELRREIKRCKHCLVFSGARVSIDVPCGDQSRIIRSDILDRDMFDPGANTPRNTSWTMQLLARLDQPLGPGVMDKPIFSFDAGSSSAIGADPTTLEELKAGKFDALFADAPDKPSQLYARAVMAPPPAPSVTLVSSTIFPPDVYVAPSYPVIAQAARVEGRITFEFVVDSKGMPGKATPLTGPMLLYSTLNAALARWRFAEPAFNQQIRVTLDYALNCPSHSE